MITTIDFHIDDHLVQCGNGLVLIFPEGNTKKPPIEFGISDLMRALNIADAQLEDAK